MNKEQRVYLDDISTSCQRISEYIKGVRKAQFEKDLELQDAVIRRFEIIGEAIKRLSREFRGQHPGIAWRKATGMRDILIHAYDEVDLEQVWDTITEALPSISKQIKKLLQLETA
jgi:uncharacterized protein with HEPN domain